MENCSGTEADDIMCEPCDHTTDTISRSTNVNPSTVSQDRTRPLLNNSGHCLENCTGSRSEFEDATALANSATYNHYISFIYDMYYYYLENHKEHHLRSRIKNNDEGECTFCRT